MGQAFRTQFTAQASNGPAADTFSAGAITDIDLATSANAEGAYDINLELNVTVAPSTATYAEVWIAESNDGTNYGEYKFVCTMQGILTSAARYTETIQVSAPKLRLKWKPIAYGMTATLNARPSYPA